MSRANNVPKEQAITSSSTLGSEMANKKTSRGVGRSAESMTAYFGAPQISRDSTARLDVTRDIAATNTARLVSCSTIAGFLFMLTFPHFTSRHIRAASDLLQ
ncbi:hypothetical protein N7462_009231 [Penicillium macrosclerotiorum]|uniref:uncharacterized protein n=1 Tax=Penicillium macrosclerotiorum TaxID=303699 RepID=UPI0025482589|nr:uncharacterized protein N7462_009231 [Penicillium macrosclerotiorum]KAJ5673792.1 hypothetical protein N7462_009231 [Penicillium macrosclerotiorum]